jgi:putative redox protein
MITVNSVENDFQCTVLSSKHSFSSDISSEKGGHDKGMSPHELLAASIGTCINIWLRIQSRKRDIHLNFLSVSVSLERLDTDTVFVINVSFPDYISDSEKHELYSEIQFCPIKKTLSKNIFFQINKPEV